MVIAHVHNVNITNGHFVERCIKYYKRYPKFIALFQFVKNFTGIRTDYKKSTNNCAVREKEIY